MDPSFREIDRACNTPEETLDNVVPNLAVTHLRLWGWKVDIDTSTSDPDLALRVEKIINLFKLQYEMKAHSNGRFTLGLKYGDRKVEYESNRPYIRGKTFVECDPSFNQYEVCRLKEHYQNIWDISQISVGILEEQEALLSEVMSYLEKDKKICLQKVAFDALFIVCKTISEEKMVRVKELQFELHLKYKNDDIEIYEQYSIQQKQKKICS